VPFQWPNWGALGGSLETFWGSGVSGARSNNGRNLRSPAGNYVMSHHSVALKRPISTNWESNISRIVQPGGNTSMGKLMMHNETPIYQEFNQTPRPWLWTFCQSKSITHSGRSNAIRASPRRAKLNSALHYVWLGKNIERQFVMCALSLTKSARWQTID
jgi:hypothetical protein